jgi:geranylgeranyl diphosphate synthase type I
MISGRVRAALDALEQTRLPADAARALSDLARAATVRLH